jgi:hypothetical protein
VRRSPDSQVRSTPSGSVYVILYGGNVGHMIKCQYVGGKAHLTSVAHLASW